MTYGDYILPNHHRIAHETIDGEVVIVNLENGSYYNVEGCGTEIWNMIVRGTSRLEIVEHLRANFDAGNDEIESSLDQFLGAVAEEGLIIVGRPEQGVEPTDQDLPPDGVEGRKRHFVAPELNVYKDMQDLLLLDPIHEVDETGWPDPKKP